jgi:hypothetical protein
MSARDVQEDAVVLAVEHFAARVFNQSKRQPQLGKEVQQREENFVGSLGRQQKENFVGASELQ